MGELILITGATGHIGFRTFIFALKAGYKVRAAVRSQAKADLLRNHAEVKALNLSTDALTFAIVPEITAKGAYTEAVRGVTYILHLASPLVSGFAPEELMAKPDELMINPALRGTLEMIEAASKESSVRRVVITASVVSLIPFSAFAAPADPPATFNAHTRVPNHKGDKYVHPFDIYFASKARAFNETEQWVKEHSNATFDVVNIHPSFVIGRNVLETTKAGILTGSNQTLENVTGVKAAMPRTGTTVYVEDVANLHVWSLDENIVKPAPATSRSFIANGPPVVIDDAKAIAKKYFPEAYKKGILSDEGSMTTATVYFDSTDTEKTFGFTFKGFETQVKDLVGYYVEVAERT